MKTTVRNATRGVTCRPREVRTETSSSTRGPVWFKRLAASSVYGELPTRKARSVVTMATVGGAFRTTAVDPSTVPSTVGHAWMKRTEGNEHSSWAGIPRKAAREMTPVQFRQRCSRPRQDPGTTHLMSPG
jgi:hypothetical protein